jgi:hypothetical protein
MSLSNYMLCLRHPLLLHNFPTKWLAHHQAQISHTSNTVQTSPKNATEAQIPSRYIPTLGQGKAQSEITYAESCSYTKVTPAEVREQFVIGVKDVGPGAHSLDLHL